MEKLIDGVLVSPTPSLLGHNCGMMTTNNVLYLIELSSWLIAYKFAKERVIQNEQVIWIASLSSHLSEWEIESVNNKKIKGLQISLHHYSDVIMRAMAYQITGVSIVCSSSDQRKHQSSASLGFVRGIHQIPLRQRASKEENVFIWWRHQGIFGNLVCLMAVTPYASYTISFM